MPLVLRIRITLNRYYSSLWYSSCVCTTEEGVRRHYRFFRRRPLLLLFSLYHSVTHTKSNHFFLKCNFLKSEKMSPCQSRHPLSTTLLFLLFLLDVTSDVATGIELYLNDHYFYGWAVLGLVLLPSVASILSEFMRSCVYGGCCGEANTHWIPLIFYHPYTAFM